MADHQGSAPRIVLDGDAASAGAASLRSLSMKTLTSAPECYGRSVDESNYLIPIGSHLFSPRPVIKAGSDGASSRSKRRARST